MKPQASGNVAPHEHAGMECEAVEKAAQSAEARGDWEEALRLWRQVAQQTVHDRRSYMRIAHAHIMLGDIAAARRWRIASQYGIDLVSPAAPLTPPGPSTGAARCRWRWVDFLALVMTKALMNVKSEAARTRLNYVWVIIEPMLHLIIYYVLFSKLLHTGENYGLFLLSGLVPWMWFSKSISTSASSILGGQSLMLNSKVAPEFFPLVSVMQATLKQLPALLLLLSLGMMTDPETLSWALLYLPVIMVVQLLLTAVLSLLLAAAVSMLRDLANLVGTGLTLLMFISGVIYQLQTLPGAVGYWISLNPLTLIISAYREVILQGHSPNGADLVYVLGVTLLAGTLAFFVYTHQRRHFVRRGMS